MGEALNRFNVWNIRMYYVSIVLLAASIPLSKFTTSVSQFGLLGFWLLYKANLSEITVKPERNVFISYFLYIPAALLRVLFFSLVDKFRQFFRNRTALILSSLLLLHVAGLIYSSDFHYAFKDLRTKLPLFLLPLFLSTGPKVTAGELKWIFSGYILAILGGTLYRLYLYESLPIADTRGLSAHISHIRFSLNTVFSIFILLYYILKPGTLTTWLKLAAILLILWFIFFMTFMGYLTGLSILAVVSISLVLYKSFSGKSLIIRVTGIAATLLLIMIPLYYFNHAVNEYRHTDRVNFQQLDKYTMNQNSYYHDTVNFRIENGRYTGLYICDKELRREWIKRSSHPIDSLDAKQQVLRFTLIRYLSSMDVRKDSAGMSQLGKEDIRRIEAGITQANPHPEFSPLTQIDHFMTGWDNYIRHGNPNSSSLIQRIEYWRTSLVLIGRHPIFGVGTGDVPDAFRSYYNEIKSKLDPQYRLRSHNQYLSITVAFGLFGLSWFLIVLFAPFRNRNVMNNYHYIIFWIIFIISMLTEDTLETQEGVTFYAFFSALFLLAIARATGSAESNSPENSNNTEKLP